VRTSKVPSPGQEGTKTASKAQLPRVALVQDKKKKKTRGKGGELRTKIPRPDIGRKKKLPSQETKTFKQQGKVLETKLS